MGKAIGLISIKGGVGKTTLSASLASSLANDFDKKVLLVDGNYSAPNLGLHMDVVRPKNTIHDVLRGKAKLKDAIHHVHGVDVVPGNLSPPDVNCLKLKDKLKHVKGKYDFTIIDSSPSLNDEILSTMLASDSLMVVSTPDYPTLSCSLHAAKMAKQRGRPVAGIIVNKIRNPRYELTVDDIEEATGIPVVAKVPDDKDNVKALYLRTPLSLHKPKSKFSRELKKLTAALTNQEERKGVWGKLMGRFSREEVNRQLLREHFYQRVF